jgi:hypothetical protein
MLVPTISRSAGRAVRRASIGSALFIVIAVAIIRPWNREHERVHAQDAAHTPAPELYADKAVACMTLGNVRPPINVMDDAQLDRVLLLLGHVLCAYEGGSFESFIELRRGDLAFAEQSRAQDTDNLRAYAIQLGVPESSLAGDYIGSLQVFWNAFYKSSPVYRFVPESTSIMLQDGRLAIDDWRKWSESFDALCVGKTVFQHRLAIPHRVELAQLLARVETLTWLDLSIEFECRGLARRRLVMRAVWDEPNAEWFVYRASTVHIESRGQESVTSNLIL